MWVSLIVKKTRGRRANKSRIRVGLFLRWQDVASKDTVSNCIYLKFMHKYKRPCPTLNYGRLVECLRQTISKKLMIERICMTRLPEKRGWSKNIQVILEHKFLIDAWQDILHILIWNVVMQVCCLSNIIWNAILSEWFVPV